MIDKISLADGKYTVLHKNGVLTAERYGEPWRDMTGDNLMFYLVMRVLDLESEKNSGPSLDELRSQLGGIKEVSGVVK